MVIKHILIKVVGVILVLMFIPFFGMVFTNEVQWDLYDFTLMGFMIFTTAIFCIITVKKVDNAIIRRTILILLGLLFLLTWAELAVVIFDHVLLSKQLMC